MRALLALSLLWTGVAFGQDFTIKAEAAWEKSLSTPNEAYAAAETLRARLYKEPSK